jgi:hypothetical protein
MIPLEIKAITTIFFIDHAGNSSGRVSPLAGQPRKHRSTLEDLLSAVAPDVPARKVHANP